LGEAAVAPAFARVARRGPWRGMAPGRRHAPRPQASPWPQGHARLNVLGERQLVSDGYDCALTRVLADPPDRKSVGSTVNCTSERIDDEISVDSFASSGSLPSDLEREGRLGPARAGRILGNSKHQRSVSSRALPSCARRHRGIAARRHGGGDPAARLANFSKAKSAI